MTPEQVGYFGCWETTGHYLYGMEGKRYGYFPIGPWTAGKLDDPDRWHGKETQQQGAVRLHVVDGWTLLCMRDNSVDTRPGSHAIFLAEGEHTASEMWEIGREYFPMVYERLKRWRPASDRSQP